MKYLIDNLIAQLAYSTGTREVGAQLCQNSKFAFGSDTKTLLRDNCGRSYKLTNLGKGLKLPNPQNTLSLKIENFNLVYD